MTQIQLLGLVLGWLELSLWWVSSFANSIDTPNPHTYDKAARAGPKRQPSTLIALRSKPGLRLLNSVPETN